MASHDAGNHVRSQRLAQLPVPGELDSTPMVHLYRGEINRMTVWRQRLDITSNWTILLTIGLTTFTLGGSAVPHYTLLLGLALIGISVVIEARRYQHVHHSKWRVHLLELGYFAELLEPSAGRDQPPWREWLADDLRWPRLKIGLLLATRARLRRNYLPLIYFITGVWVTKLFIHPHSPESTREFLARFAVGGLVPPWFVASTAMLFIVVATLLAITCPTLEQLEDWGPLEPGEPSASRSQS